jgi:hypothetical protein
MFTRTGFLLAALLASTLAPGQGRAQASANVDRLSSRILAWFDKLDLPDVSGKLYVRIDTGLWIEPADGPRPNQFVEGFLLKEDEDSFTVFISGVREFHPPDDRSVVPSLGESDIRFAPLRTVRFKRVFDNGSETGRASYQVLDLGVRAAALIERVRQQTLVDGDFNDLLWPLGFPAPGAQVVAFAHALRQSGREPQGDELLHMFIRAGLADGTQAWENPLARLQENLGRTFVEWAEADMTDGIIPRAQLIDVYARFGSLFPPSDTGINFQRDYMKRSAAVLRRMAAEEAAHVARPLASLTPAEQAAELIYQLRDLHLPFSYQAAGGVPYPFEPWMPQNDSEKTPVHRLVDLGDAAVPVLIAALGDESFTRTDYAGMKAHPIRAMRVNDVALAILEHMAGQRFPREPDGGPWDIARSRPYVEKWWAEKQGGAD